MERKTGIRPCVNTDQLEKESHNTVVEGADDNYLLGITTGPLNVARTAVSENNNRNEYQVLKVDGAPPVEENWRTLGEVGSRRSVIREAENKGEQGRSNGPTAREEQQWAEKLSAITGECERLLSEGELLSCRNSALQQQVGIISK